MSTFMWHMKVKVWIVEGDNNFQILPKEDTFHVRAYLILVVSSSIEGWSSMLQPNWCSPMDYLLS